LGYDADSTSLSGHPPQEDVMLPYSADPTRDIGLGVSTPASPRDHLPED
jgi:hypothetical protein